MSAIKSINRYCLCLSFLLLLALAAVVVSQAQRGTSGLIKESTLRAHIKYLSDDLLEGRGTGATGGELAAKYIAEQLEALGLKGAGEKGRYFQPVMLVNDPPATPQEPNLFGARALTYYGRWTYKYEEGARRGAAGVILLHTDESAGYPWSVVRTSNGSWRFDIARGAGDKTPYLKMRAWMTDAAGHRLMKLAGQDLDA